jgi:hypothetical protein
MHRQWQYIRYSAKAPTAATSSWKRTAKLVKKTTVQNQYLEHIREIHSPEMQHRTMEDEIKGTMGMGMALGKQAHKIEMYITLMEEQFEEYQSLKHRLEVLFDVDDDDDDNFSSADEQRRQYQNQKQMLDIAKVYNGSGEGGLYRSGVNSLCIGKRWVLSLIIKSWCFKSF